MKTVIVLLQILALLVFLACEQSGKSDQAPKGDAGVSEKAATETVQEAAKPAAEAAKQGAEAVTGAAKEKTQ